MDRPRASGEAGFTLIELLVVASVGLVVFAAALGLIRVATSSEAATRERGGQIQQARTMIEAITREVRQGDGVAIAAPSQLAVVTWVNRASCGGAPAESSIQCRVTYQCSGATCTRAETPPDTAATAPGPQVAEGLASSDVFTYSPTGDPTFVGVELELGETPAEEAVTLEAGIALRNATLG